MKKRIKIALAVFNIFCWPVVFLYFCSNQRKKRIIQEDLVVWNKAYDLTEDNKLLAVLFLLTWVREFRSLLYYRLGINGISIIYPPSSISYYINK